MATEAIKIDAQSRQKLGSRESKRLRKNGFLPAVVYGHGQEVKSVALPFRQAAYHILHGAHLFELGLDGQAEQVLIKDVQFDAIGKEILHVDFYRVSADERVSVEVTIQFKGTAVGVTQSGGVLLHDSDSVEIECRAVDIPDYILADVSALDVGDHLTAGELKLPEGVSLVTEPDHLIASVQAKRTADEEPAEEPATEPELIGREKKDEGEEGEK